MDNVPFTTHPVDDRSYVSYIKRQIHNALVQSDFSKARIAQADIVVSELASNLVKHAMGGEIMYRLTTRPEGPLLELLTIDSGPGIPDVQRMMKDGVSTTNTLGQGLGAIQRLSSRFSIYSLPRWGTVSYAAMTGDADQEVADRDLEVSALCVPKPRETACGDGYAVHRTRDTIRVMFGDGLGHGEPAREAVETAVRSFHSTASTDPVDILRSIHSSVRKTRGLVATVAVLDVRKKQWRLCGVGNISTRIYGGIIFKHYLPYNGIVGLNIPGAMAVTTIPAEKNQQLIMCSDGLRTRWDISRYPSILKSPNMILAAALYKDFNRRTDDSSILIGKVIFEK